MLVEILDTYGKIAVESLKQDVEKVSATHKTSASIHYEVKKEGTAQSLLIYGRKFFKALETGRGPRKNNEYQQYDVSMYEYMQARGIGADLPEKKRKQLARFLAWKINKEGDKTFKTGGRQVYSDNLNRIVQELIAAVKKDTIGMYIAEIRSAAKAV